MVGRGCARVLDSFGLSAQCRCEFGCLFVPCPVGSATWPCINLRHWGSFCLLQLQCFEHDGNMPFRLCCLADLSSIIVSFSWDGVGRVWSYEDCQEDRKLYGCFCNFSLQLGSMREKGTPSRMFSSFRAGVDSQARMFRDPSTPIVKQLFSEKGDLPDLQENCFLSPQVSTFNCVLPGRCCFHYESVHVLIVPWIAQLLL